MRNMTGREKHTYREKVEAGVDCLRKRLPFIPEYGIVLGTGLGSIADDIEGRLEIPYGDIPGFSLLPTVVGHAGHVIAGKFGRDQLIFLSGRTHYYEGFTTREMTIPVRVLSLLGIKKMIVTNAAGGLNPKFRTGDIMLIRDHINLIGDNPLRGPNIDEWGPRFPDMSQVYDTKLRAVCKSAALDLALDNFAEGIYGAVPGPSLETPAETHYLRQCGVDAVGMSTVPEVIVARHGGVHVLGLSVIANVHTPDNPQPISVDEILANMNMAALDLRRLIMRVVGSKWHQA